jgi:hypothetical protein
MTDTSSSESTTSERAPGRRPDGPPAGVLAAISLALSVCAILVPLAVSGTGYPTPSSSADVTASYFGTHSFAGTLTGFFSFAASVPIGIYAATVYARLLRLGIRVPGPGIALFGGVTASILLAASGLLTWALGQASGGAPARVVHMLTDFVFALGGVGFVGGVGLLIAGIAVPSVVLRLVPRWLGWLGLILAALSEVSFLALLWPGFDVLLPVGRFIGLLWLIAIGFLLPHNRHEIQGTRQVLD